MLLARYPFRAMGSPCELHVYGETRAFCDALIASARSPRCARLEQQVLALPRRQRDERDQPERRRPGRRRASTTRPRACSTTPRPRTRRAAGSSTRPRACCAGSGTSSPAACPRQPSSTRCCRSSAGGACSWARPRLVLAARGHGARLRRLREGVRRRSRRRAVSRARSADTGWWTWAATSP